MCHYPRFSRNQICIFCNIRISIQCNLVLHHNNTHMSLNRISWSSLLRTLSMSHSCTLHREGHSLCIRTCRRLSYIFSDSHLRTRSMSHTGTLSKLDHSQRTHTLTHHCLIFCGSHLRTLSMSHTGTLSSSCPYLCKSRRYSPTFSGIHQGIHCTSPTCTLHILDRSQRTPHHSLSHTLRGSR